jgi:hypothetical protein
MGSPHDASPSRPAVTVSVDVDPVDLHLLGYGHRKLAPDLLVYERALPRLLEIFARTGVRATFFVVGRDAGAARASLAAMVAAGHEVASHSHSHPMAFGRLSPIEMRRELAASKQALENAGGGPVVGFRAPNFDVDPPVVKALVETGYRYDASGYPTPILFPVRAMLAFKSKDPRGVFMLRLWPFSMKRAPFRWEAEGYAVHEFPTAVTPWLRMPFYHTMRYYISETSFENRLADFARRGETLSYPLHAVDALGLAEDHVNPLLRAHPGMNWELGRKLSVLESSLASIARRFEPLPFRERLDPVG